MATYRLRGVLIARCSTARCSTARCRGSSAVRLHHAGRGGLRRGQRRVWQRAVDPDVLEGYTGAEAKAFSHLVAVL